MKTFNKISAIMGFTAAGILIVIFIFENELVYLIGAVISIIYALMFWKICHVVNDFEKLKEEILKDVKFLKDINV